MTLYNTTKHSVTLHITIYMYSITLHNTILVPNASYTSLLLRNTKPQTRGPGALGHALTSLRLLPGVDVQIGDDLMVSSMVGEYNFRN